MVRVATRVRDYTNLGWPEAPFGADQRPFGKRWDMLAGFAIGWTSIGGRETMPASVATVYLRIRRRGNAAYDVHEETLSIGFRVAVVDHEHESESLVALLDRALVRARRHAAILAGDNLGDDLDRIVERSKLPLRGAVSVRDAWRARGVQERGVALMVDTSVEASEVAAEFGSQRRLLHASATRSGADGPDPASCARETVMNALVVGLAAASHTGRYRWQGAFDVRDAVDRAGWDILPSDSPGPTRTDGGVGRQHH